MKLRGLVAAVAVAAVSSVPTLAFSFSMSSSRPPSSSLFSSSSSASDDVVVVGLNGALQKRFILDSSDPSLIPGNVHRATRVETGVGGKGQDVAIALHCLDDTSSTSSSSCIQLCQFVGRDDAAGQTVYQLLQDRLGPSAMDLTIQTSSPTRTCTSIVASKETTELVEPSGTIAPEELEALMQRLEDRYGGGHGNGHHEKNNGNDDRATTTTPHAVRALCIMGSIPPGVAVDTYGKIFAKIMDKKTVCVVDSIVGIPDLIEAATRVAVVAAAAAATDQNGTPQIILKINASELCKLAETSKKKSETGGIDQDELQEAICGFFNNFSPQKAIHGLAITDGQHPSYMAIVDEESFRLYQLPVPKLDSSKTLYPIGAGDAVAAGLLAAWSTLTRIDDDMKSIVPQDSVELLLKCSASTGTLCKDSEGTYDTDSLLLAALAFGLCCGSASCLQEENSVLDPSDVVSLFRQYGKLEKVGKFSHGTQKNRRIEKSI